MLVNSLFSKSLDQDQQIKGENIYSVDKADTDDTIDIVSISWDLLVSVSVSVSIFHISESQYRFFTSLGLSLSTYIDFSDYKVSIWA